MPILDQIKKKAYHAKYIRKHYNQNKLYYKQKNKEKRRELSLWLRNYKLNLKCKMCPEHDWRCVDFHHRDPKNKFKEVSVMVHQCYSIKRILEEIMKCDPLCANCHRKHTMGFEPT